MRQEDKENPKLKRGDVYIAKFNPPDDPKQVIDKYVVVLQEGMIVENSATVVCVNLTTRHLDDVYPWDVLIDPGESRSVAGAKVICSQLHSIPKDNLMNYKYSLRPETMNAVNQGLLLGTGIFKYESILSEGEPE